MQNVHWHAASGYENGCDCVVNENANGCVNEKH
jgi:hypothetical protein